MGVDLFNKYYQNPDKQYLKTNMICSGAADGSYNFNIAKSSANISSGDELIASLDLSGINEKLTEYNKETRVIEAYDFVYIKGFNKGRTYQRNVFLSVPKELMDDEDMLYITGLEFYIDYYRNGIAKRVDIKTSGSLKNEQTILEAVQEILDNNQIKVTITLDGNLFVFTGTETGYEFHIGCDSHPNAIKCFSHIDVNDPTNEYPHDIEELMYDYCPAYVPPFKYRNGAFRGVIINPKYPEYNANSISDIQRSLKVAFVPNRIHMDLPVRVAGRILYDQRNFDIIADYSDMMEKQRFEQWRNIDESTLCEDECYYKHLANRNILGIYGFVDWMYEHNNEGWANVGSLFANIAPIDTQDTSDKNLIPGFVVYNPNPFPVIINTMLFV